MEQPRPRNRSKAILLAGLLLGGYLSLLIALVYFGQAHLRGSLDQQARLLVEKQAAAVGFFFSEQRDAIQELTRSSALKNFFANRALGMSMEYGLRASLHAVGEELGRVRERKRLQGRRIYSRIGLVDRDGSVLITTGDGEPAPRQSVQFPDGDSGVSLSIERGPQGQGHKAVFFGRVTQNDRIIGWVVAETDLVKSLAPLLQQTTSAGPNSQLALLDSEERITLVPSVEGAGQIDSSQADLMSLPVPESALALSVAVTHGPGQGLLTSHWLPVAIALLTLPVFGGVWYALRLNNRHLLLRASYDANRAQQKALHRFRELLNLSTDLIAEFDPATSRFLDVNEALCDFLSLEREQLLRRRLISLSGLFRSRRQWDAFVADLREKGRMTIVDSGSFADGRAFHIEVKVHFAQTDGKESIVAVGRDISERKAAEQALELANQRFGAVLEGIESAVYVADMESREVLYENPKAVELFGSLIGKKCWQALQPGRDHPCDFCPNERLFGADGEPGQTLTWEFQNPDDERWLHCAARAIPWDDGRYGRLEVATDVSSRVEHERALRAAHQQLQAMAYRDPLTGLANRRLFLDRLQQAIYRADRSGTQLAVCYMDLDGFKAINDRFGHALGDKLLVQVASRLRATLRGEDTVARWGGDEFALLIGAQHDEEACTPALERLLEALSDEYDLSEAKCRLGASIGVTLYPSDKGDPDTLLRHADQALYAAKERGRGGYYFFDSAQDRRLNARRKHIRRIDTALQQHEMRLHYQPRVNIRQGRVVGVEALVRWQHRELGLLLPGSFLPIMKGHELQCRLDWWVLNQAAKAVAAWREQGMDLAVSINLHPRTILQPAFSDRVMALLKQMALPGNRVELEILESGAIHDLDAVATVMHQCAESGVSFALDDFGTGYSSLNHIRRLPVKTLKIDRSFVRDMLKDRDDFNIVEGVVGLAHAFERDVIAEGVETPEIANRLLQLGCEQAQGYWIAKPMPESALTDWVRGYRIPADWQGAGAGMRVVGLDH